MLKIQNDLDKKSKINSKQKESMKGITLIALVITIIVLLILAGVSIATLTGENGILTRANEAKENTQQTSEDELRKLTQAEAATYLEDHEYTDVSGEKVTIPAKCAVSQVDGENTLEDGLVIIDANGNEWVWVEVPESITSTATTDAEIKNTLISYTTEYRGDYSDTWYEGCGLEEQEYYNKYSKMLQSIKTNGGFYIGRYEVGIKEDINRNFDEEYVTEHSIDETPVIQQDKYVYNWIRCNQAQQLAEQLAIGKKTTSLMFGIQWDLVLKYLEIKGNWNTTTNKAIYYLKTNSSSWGNYNNVTFNILRGRYSLDDGINYIQVDKKYQKPVSSVLLTTGATKRNSKMNIYDLAGNVWEWTLEKSSSVSNWCACRGGVYNSGDKSNYPAARRGDGITSYSDKVIGFRAVLY